MCAERTFQGDTDGTNFIRLSDGIVNYRDHDFDLYTVRVNFPVAVHTDAIFNFLTFDFGYCGVVPRGAYLYGSDTLYFADFVYATLASSTLAAPLP